jgi:hypothetical protein
MINELPRPEDGLIELCAARRIRQQSANLLGISSLPGLYEQPYIAAPANHDVD